MNTKSFSTYGSAAPKVAAMVFACLLASSLTSHAEVQAVASPSDQVDMIFEQFDKPDSPGCAVAVIKDGGIIYKRGYGMADLGRGIAITPSTVFHAASLAKQFTAMSIMLLVQRGKLELSDPVDNYLNVPIATRTFGKHMTIGEMLSHISGIRDQWVLVTLAGLRLYDDMVTQDEVLKLVSRMKTVDFKPRDDFLYSNTGFTLAGLIVKKVTGQSLGDFAYENIFRPLRMNDTLIINTHDQVIYHSALGYTDKTFQLWMPKLDVTGPTNLETTVEDLARWDRNFDDKTVGGAGLLSQMQTPAKLSNNRFAELGKDDDGNIIHYGLGLELTKYRELNVVEHDGRDAGFRAHLIRFPEQHFAVACLCNLALPENKLPRKLVRKVADIYLVDQLAPRPAGQPSAVATSLSAPPTPAQLAAFTGRYHSEEVDATYQVVLQPDSSLVIRRPNYNDTPLKPASLPAGLFAIDDFGQTITNGTVLFTRTQEKVTGFFLSGFRGLQPRITKFPFTKLP
jgi:CubicO group peptidase (beta-lactamase class C family)